MRIETPPMLQPHADPRFSRGLGGLFSRSDSQEDPPAAVPSCSGSAYGSSSSSCSFNDEQEVAKRIALLYDNMKLSDVTFSLQSPESADGRVRFPAHRNIVSVWSGPLNAMLNGGWCEGGSKEIMIKDVCPVAFEAMLKFMYTGMVNIDTDNVLSLLDAAGRFDVQPIVNFCVTFLHQHTTAEYACQMLEVGVQYNLERLIDKSIELIVTDNNVLESEDFLKLSRSAIDYVTKHDSWNLHEDEIFDFILRWADAHAPPGEDSEKRELYLKPIIQGIRFPHLSVGKLRKLSNESIVPLNLIFDALFFKLHSETTVTSQEATSRYRPRPGSVLFSWCPTPKITVSGSHHENARHTSSNGFTGVRGNRRMVNGIYCWTIEVVETQSSWIFFGICNADDRSDCAWRNTGRMMYLLDSRTFHQGSGSNHPQGDRKISNGDRVTAILDCTHHTLSFSVNGENQWLAFRDLPASQPFVPALDLRDCGDKVRLLGNNNNVNADPPKSEETNPILQRRMTVDIVRAGEREVPSRHQNQPRQSQ